jgi:hypothetical protein
MLFENSRNSSVITAHTVCTPVSLPSVSQHPFRYQPVMGFVQQVEIVSPKTFN